MKVSALIVGALLLGVAGCQSSPEVAHDPMPMLMRNSPPTDLAGAPVNPLATPDARAVVLVFISNDCPISNRYAPELRRLKESFEKRGVSFWLVHANTDESAASIRKHSKDYDLPFNIARDPGRQLVHQALATVTPEAAVFLPGGKLIYHGRIDDRFPALGKDRVEPTRHDLREVLTAALAGQPVPYSFAQPVGCSIPDAL